MAKNVYFFVNNYVNFNVVFLKQAVCVWIVTGTDAASKEVKAPPSSVDLVNILRSDIVFGRLQPKERLVEEQLCERFQVKRYALRNALDQLEILGLVIRRPNRGAAVNALSIAEIDQLYEMRSILHRAAVTLIPDDAFADIADRLETIQVDFRKCLAEGDYDGLASTDSRFHGELYKACGNRYLFEAIELHWQKTVFIHSYSYGKTKLSAQSAKEHDQIIAVTRTGDRGHLTKLCNDHMLLSLEVYKDRLADW